MSKTAVEANEERGSDERKAKWDCLCKVQGGMSSSSTNPVQVASHSTRMPKKRECNRRAGDNPRCSETTGHHSLISNSASKYASTSSEPHANACPICYTIARAHSELIEIDTSWTIDDKDENKLLSPPRSGQVQDQWADKVWARKTLSATTQVQ